MSRSSDFKNDFKNIGQALLGQDGKASRDTVGLAFLGDAVYEVYIRSRLLAKGLAADKLHSKSVIYVNANAQAQAVKEFLQDLSQEEEEVVKRARNHKVRTKAKNVDLRTYKWATGFEALLGWLAQTGQEERLLDIMERAARITEGK